MRLIDGECHWGTGWDKIIEGGITAAQEGHDVVMVPTTHLYFDYPYTTTPLEKVYNFEPIPTELTPEQAQHVLGAQAQMWTDNHPTEKEIEQLVYPRACAI